MHAPYLGVLGSTLYTSHMIFTCHAMCLTRAMTHLAWQQEIALLRERL